MLLFDITNLFGTGKPLNTTDKAKIFLLVDNDGTFSSGATIVKQATGVTSGTNEVHFKHNFNDGDYFTLAVGQEFVPGGISGSLLWLRADKGGVNWTDESGKSTPTTLTSTGSPTAGTLMNFNATNKFSGSEYYTTDLSINAGTHADLSVIAVYKPSKDAAALYGERIMVVGIALFLITVSQ